MRDIRSVTVWGDSVMKGVVYDEEKERYTLLAGMAARIALPGRWDIPLAQSFPHGL